MNIAPDALDKPLVEQLALLARGDLAVIDLTEAALERAQRLQSVLNCFIRIDHEGAIARARELDRLPSKRRRALPLFGAPVAHKDMFARQDRIVTFGSRLYAEHRASTTATVVHRFQAAGAVDIGSLNLSEFACNPYGLNILVGRARNPWDPERISGGSSSGSAAALSARIIAASMGSDTGGSIRGPAAACGVFGLLPTNGRVSRYGMLPLSHSLDNAGPLARSARDIARVLGIIAGIDPNDPYSSDEPVPDYEATIDADLSGVRIGTAANYYPEAVDDDTSDMMTKTVSIFQNLGASLLPLEVPDPRPLDSLGNLIIGVEAAAYHREDLREHSDLYTPLVRDRILCGFSFDGPSYVDALRLRARELRRYLDSVFTKVDALLLPTMPHCAPLYSDVEAALAGAGDLNFTLGRFTRSMNYLGLPALAVPHGRDKLGMPLGFQLVGRPFDEGRILQIASAFERGVPPCFPAFPSVSASTQEAQLVESH